MRAIPFLVALAACDFYPEEAPDTSTSGATGACSTAIPIPSFDGQLQLATTAHAETYGASPTPFAAHLGLASNDPTTSVAWTWRTDADTLATMVEWGVGDALDQRSEGASFLFGGLEPDSGDHRVHEVRLCEGLQAGTTYSYRVGGEGGWSPTYQFTTPPEPGTAVTMTVAIAGDSRGAYETWGALVAMMEQYEPDFYLFSGDMVDLGPNQGEWDAWFDASGDVFARKLFLPAHGNHEFLAPNYFAQFALPGNEEWYAVRIGDISVVSLNDTVRDPSVWETDEVALMDEAFGAAPDDWKIVEHHQPIYSTCTTHGSNEILRDLWEPVFDRHAVDLVFAGHNHIYERSVPIRAGSEVSANQGTLYVVSGGAGADLYPNSDADWFGEIANPIEHFLIAEISPTEIVVTARDLSGVVIDTFTVPRKAR